MYSRINENISLGACSYFQFIILLQIKLYLPISFWGFILQLFTYVIL